MRLVLVVLVGWCALSVVAGIVLARGATMLKRADRDLRLAAPLPVDRVRTTDDVGLAPALVVAIHGLRDSVALVADGGQALREGWASMDEHQRSQAVDALVRQAGLVRSVVDDLLHGAPSELRAALDSLAEGRPLEVDQLAASELVAVGGRRGAASRPSASAGGAVPAEPVARTAGPLRPARRPFTAVAAGLGIAVLSASAAAAASGTLPAPAQELVGRAADAVGLDLPVRRSAPITPPPVAPTTTTPPVAEGTRHAEGRPAPASSAERDVRTGPPTSTPTADATPDAERPAAELRPGAPSRSDPGKPRASGENPPRAEPPRKDDRGAAPAGRDDRGGAEQGRSAEQRTSVRGDADPGSQDDRGAKGKGRLGDEGRASGSRPASAGSSGAE